MKNPLMILTIFFCCGIFLAHMQIFSFFLAYLLVLALLFLSLLFIKKKLLSGYCLCGLVFSLGLASLSNSGILAKCDISQYAFYKHGDLHTATGEVISEPSTGHGRVSFIFLPREIQLGNLKYDCCGRVFVRIKGGAVLNYGDRLMLTGNLEIPFSRNGLNRTSFKGYLQNQGIYSVMNVESASAVKRLASDSKLDLKRFAMGFKKKAESILIKYLSPLCASIVNAMVLGEKRDIPRQINQSMMQTGTVHILVVSGFNVGIVAFVALMFLKALRFPRLPRFCLAIILLLFYCLLTGASNPVMRATVMAIIFIAAFFVKREPDIYNSLSIAALSILLFNPRQLFDIGFQLSFVSVISIVSIYPRLKSFVKVGLFNIKWLKFIIEGILVSFSAWLGTMGLIAYYFRMFSPITVLANLLIVPLASLITLCGFTLMLVSLVSPLFALLFASTLELLVSLLLRINSCLVALPWAYFYL